MYLASGLLECEVDEVKRHGDQDEEEAEADRRRPAVPGADDPVHLSVRVVAAFRHWIPFLSISLTALRMRVIGSVLH
jgi:hypothetical protein